MRSVFKGILVATALVFSGAASAQITWDWSFTDVKDHNSGSGTLTTKGLSSGSYVITSMTGLWDGSTITGLEPVGSLPLVPSNDNLLLKGAIQLDYNGLYFGVAGHAGENLFYDGVSYDSEPSNLAYVDYAGSFSAHQVAVQAPEMDPNSAAGGLALLIGGVLVLRGRTLSRTQRLHTV
jgi:hypothetical protein